MLVITSTLQPVSFFTLIYYAFRISKVSRNYDLRLYNYLTSSFMIGLCDRVKNIYHTVLEKENWCFYYYA